MKVAVVIPAFRVSRHILDVLARMPDAVDQVFVVDDCCPDGSGALVESTCSDPRVTVLRHDRNQGVGGAVLTGYAAALKAGADVFVKVDGDGQMPPELIPAFVAPIADGTADYAKGNRFYNLDNLSRMPRARVIGNALLSFLSKLSTGYWSVFDPTNGYTAIHAEVARLLPVDKLSRRYFFESDVMFRLSTLRAAVVDIPMDPVYGDEVSNLRIRDVLGDFTLGHARNFAKRIFYNYFLRDFSIASAELVAGGLLLAFGLVFGLAHWIDSASRGATTPTGTVVLAAVAVMTGTQLLLSFLNYDIASTPRTAIHPSLQRQRAMSRLRESVAAD